MINTFSKARLIKSTISIMLIFSLQVFAANISIDLTFPAPEIQVKDNLHHVSIPGGLKISEGGKPSLPSVGKWLVLPPGEKSISMTLENQIWVKLEGVFNIAPAGNPQKLSDPNVPDIKPDISIYDSNETYPAIAFSGLNSHLKRGVSLATFLIWPVRWNPETGLLEYLQSCVITIETEVDNQSLESYASFYRGDDQTLSWVGQQVINPGDLILYPRRDDGEVESLLIITIDEYVDLIERYAEWHLVRGIPTTIVTVSDLIESHDGVDDMEKIRAGIIDAYEEDGIGYVLLFGDDENVPHRGLCSTVNNEPDFDIPADIYFGNLDGTWNDDDDDIWGELNEADFLGEVFVGRFTASNEGEVIILTNKMMAYCDEPVIDNVLDILMVGEELGWVSMGGDYMDEVFYGSDRYNYETVGFPERFEGEFLYDRDQEWSALNHLAPLISEGYHFVHHLGHANTRYSMKFNAGQLNSDVIENDGVDNGFNIGWTQGCYSGAFDNRTTEVDNYTDDCITESFTAKLSNGFVAYCANSRYGWGSGGNTNGASQHFHREFVDATFGEGISIIGKTNLDSKEDVVPWMEAGVMRWCYYEINLFGDPTMDIWTDTPQELDPDYRDVIMIGEESYSVDTEGVADARVCLFFNGEIVALGITDENGIADLTLDEPIVEQGDISLTVIAHNYLPFYAEIESVPPEFGFPWVEEFSIDDYGWIEDGQADPGETIELIPFIRNLGSETLERLSLVISSEDRFINIVNSELVYQEIQPDQEAIAEDPLSLEIFNNAPDLHEVILEFNFEDSNRRCWTQIITFQTHAAILESNGVVVYDVEGNNNGRIDPGETAEICFSLRNTGTGRTEGLIAELFSGSPYIEIISSESVFDLIEPLSNSEAVEYFEITLSDDCPDPYRAVLYTHLENENGFQQNFLSDLRTGGQYYTFDRDPEMLEHEVLGEDNTDQWRITEHENYSLNGENCLKAGSPEADGDYIGMINCAAYLPSFVVNGSVQLAFWHKIDAEISRANEGYCYDGGFVEISEDGGDWTTINPIQPGGGEGYPYLIRHGGSPNPLDLDQPCYSGVTDWRQAQFDLSDFDETEIQLRFRFGSDSLAHGKGWFIDDIELMLPIDIEPPDNLEGELINHGARLSWDTPFVPRDDLDVDNELLGYRIYREAAEWVMLDTIARHNNYFDDLLDIESGRLMYMVTAIYTNGESQPSNFLFLEWENSASEQFVDIPTNFELGSCYPNPFNSTTLINFSIPMEANIKLSIYNTLGQELFVIKDGLQTAGNFSLPFNAGHLSSGIYLLRLQVTDQILTSRVLLIK